MTLAPGSHLGPYEIQASIGAGAMGEVYRARDPRLGRDVAVKVLPAAFTADPDRLRRFELEARAAAALNHPNILAVYDVGTRDGIPYVVSELLEGQTLREQLTAGSLSARKAVEYAVQIAHGLEAAHEQGIVHRDLKPENLLVTSNGRVKILDFGLAKLADGSGPSESGSQATHTSITMPGVVLGTGGYMSPEQIRGLPVDHRTDIFAFGAVLYEMLSGKRAFHGATAADTMMAILKEPHAPLPADRNIPAALERIVDRCLEKMPAARFQSASDLAFALEGLSSYSEPVGPVGAAPRTGFAWLPWAVAALCLVVGAALATAFFRPAPMASPATYRSSILPPEHVTFSNNVPAGGLAISPDGRRLVFTASAQDGRQMLWVRSLDGLSSQPLAGTESGGYPFWSPDSRSIAFFAGGKLKKIDVAGGSPVTLCDTPRPSGLAAGGTWNRDGVILFAQATVAIYRVPDLGGTAVQATKLDEQAGETQHWAPFFLPDGRHFLFFAAGSTKGGPDDPNGVYVASLDSSDRKLLFGGGSNAKYAGGYLIFPRERALVAQKFDVGRLELQGDAVPIADQISVGGLSGRTGAFSVSETGVLAYQSGFREVHSQLSWFDRNDKLTATVGEQADYNDLELSPDREQAAVSVLDPAKRTRDIWIFDVARGVRSRFTLDPTDEDATVWSPEGNHVVFNSRPKGYFDLYERDINGAGEPAVLLSNAQNNVPTSWSPDGKFLLYTVGGFAINNDIWLLPMSGDAAERKPTPFLRSAFNEGSAHFSPDGRWVAYVSNETGASEVYVTRFPGPNGKWPISTGGGTYPRWRADGKELFYLARNGTLMAAAVKGDGADFDVNGSKPLIEIHAANGIGGGYPYDVSADGQRFLVNTIVEATALPPITLVVNWTAAIQKP